MLKLLFLFIIGTFAFDRKDTSLINGQIPAIPVYDDPPRWEKAELKPESNNNKPSSIIRPNKFLESSSESDSDSDSEIDDEELAKDLKKLIEKADAYDDYPDGEYLQYDQPQKIEFHIQSLILEDKDSSEERPMPKLAIDPPRKAPQPETMENQDPLPVLLPKDIKIPNEFDTPIIPSHVSFTIDLTDVLLLGLSLVLLFWLLRTFLKMLNEHRQAVTPMEGQWEQVIPEKVHNVKGGYPYNEDKEKGQSEEWKKVPLP